MDEKIKAGDTVQLKSGGPLMTVDHISERLGEIKVSCVWFVDGHEKFQTFRETSLKKAESDKL